MLRTVSRILGIVTIGIGGPWSPGVFAQTNTYVFGGPGLTHRWSRFDPLTTRIRDVAVDPKGAVIACGNRNTGVLVSKHDGYTGRLHWTVELSGASAVALVVDEEGASYLVGNQYAGGFPDVFLAKVDAAGNLLWTYTYDEANNNDQGLDVALGPDDSVVVTGHANGPLEGGNFFTAKLSRSGQVLWTRQIDGGPDSIVDSGIAVGVDDQGGVLVTGTSKGTATLFTDDVVTAKYSSDGTLQWTRRHDGTDQGWDSPRDLAVTSDGGCVVVGTTENRSSGADPLVLRYGPDGTLHWIYDRGGNGGDSARAVVLDAAGNIYVAGSTFTSKNGFDILALKLRPNGQRDWQLRWDGGEGRGDGAHAIALDTLGRVFVAGHSYHWWTENDVATLVVDAPSGKVLASAFFDGPLSRHDTPLAIAADSGGGVFVGGYADGDYWSEAALVLRYDYR